MLKLPSDCLASRWQAHNCLGQLHAAVSGGHCRVLAVL